MGIILSELQDKIKKYIELEVRPYIQSHNGDIDFIKFENQTLFVRLKGACVGCPLSIFTLTYGIQERISKKIPEVKEVISVD